MTDEHRALSVSPRLNCGGHHEDTGAHPNPPKRQATTEDSGPNADQHGDLDEGRLQSFPPTDRPRRADETAHAARVELLADTERGTPRIDVFQVAGGQCACCVPLSDDSTTEGGW